MFSKASSLSKASNQGKKRTKPPRNLSKKRRLSEADHEGHSPESGFDVLQTFFENHDPAELFVSVDNLRDLQKMEQDMSAFHESLRAQIALVAKVPKIKGLGSLDQDSIKALSKQVKLDDLELDGSEIRARYVCSVFLDLVENGDSW